MRGSTRQVAGEDVYVELCHAVMLSFNAENEACMTAMIAAEITSEIIELSAGTALRSR
jgi:hypothetical protein